jgi:ADA HAT complex component 1
MPRSSQGSDGDKMDLTSDSTPTAADKTATMPSIDIEKLRRTIDAQLSLEVLLKHNELRLIDQEIAKCQIALDQLRRCAEIPYPASGPAGVSQPVSQGTGIYVLPPGLERQAVSPAPWGVADGPYSRHYAKWLLPDPQFDGGEPEPATPYSPYSSIDGRATRSLGDPSSLAGKSRSSYRTNVTAKLHALPTGYPQPREKAGPMIIKRKSDGRMVKLVCLDCRRDNFSSTQGFINHCRIAHNRNFATHDAAALASGEPVEVDESGVVVGGNNSESSSSTGTGYVHPLIRSAHAVDSPAATPSPDQPSKTVDTSVHERMQKKRKIVSPSTTNAPHLSFSASPDTPHLSTLLQSLGSNFDLRNMVGEAMTQIDLDALSCDDESEEEDEGLTDGCAPSNVHGSRLPTRMPMPQTACSDKPDSRKGFDQVTDTPIDAPPVTQKSSTYRSPYANVPPSLGSLQLDRSREADMLVDSHDNLSPNTIESNQAPSLVSDDDDDDDYEAASDSDSPGSSDAGHDDQDFDHIEVEDGDSSDTRTSDSQAVEHHLDRAAKAHAASLAKTLKRSPNRRKEEGVATRHLANHQARVNTKKVSNRRQ